MGSVDSSWNMNKVENAGIYTDRFQAGNKTGRSLRAPYSWMELPFKAPKKERAGFRLHSTWRDGAVTVITTYFGLYAGAV